ncbi:MAG TPA: fatty acid desaturase [Chitinophagaceae bacterium]|nr:fatty acid desaturase [Chitinophagaceae bacterium]
MISNLEGIRFNDVINTEGLSYSEFRQTLKPAYFRTWLHITAGFLCLAALVVTFIIIENTIPGWYWLTIPIFSVLAGFTIAFINLFIHEAGHYYLHSNKKTNDLLANIFLCSWTGLHIKVYRKIHWLHHQHLATSTDPENSYFNVLSGKFILETFSGIHVLRIMLNKNNNQLLEKELKGKSVQMLFAGLIINSAFLFAAFWFRNYQLAIVWTLAMLVFFPFFATIRQLLEHRDELANSDNTFYHSPKRKISRLFTDSILSNLLGPAGFNKHMIHHWDPVLPFTALGKAEVFLSGCEKTKEIIQRSRTTYPAAFKQLWRPRK